LFSLIRYDVANLLHLDLKIPEQNAVLDSILEDLPSDDLWDESNIIQKSYKKQLLTRYHIDHEMLGKHLNVEQEEEIHQSTLAGSGSSSSLKELLGDSTGATVKVKVENPNLHQLKQVLEVARAAEKKFNGALQGLRKLQAQVAAAQHAESVCPKF
jgi:hypothetical protein